MAGLAADSPEFDDFVSQAPGLKGISGEIDRQWLRELWTGADCDYNRAINHLLDTDDSKIVLAGGAGGSHGQQIAAPSSTHNMQKTAIPSSTHNVKSSSKSKHSSRRKDKKKPPSAAAGDEAGFASLSGASVFPQTQVMSAHSASLADHDKSTFDGSNTGAGFSFGPGMKDRFTGAPGGGAMDGGGNGGARMETGFSNVHGDPTMGGGFSGQGQNRANGNFSGVGMGSMDNSVNAWPSQSVPSVNQHSLPGQSLQNMNPNLSQQPMQFKPPVRTQAFGSPTSGLNTTLSSGNRHEEIQRQIQDLQFSIKKTQSMMSTPNASLGLCGPTPFDDDIAYGGPPMGLSLFASSSPWGDDESTSDSENDWWHEPADNRLGFRSGTPQMGTQAGFSGPASPPEASFASSFRGGSDTGHPLSFAAPSLGAPGTNWSAGSFGMAQAPTDEVSKLKHLLAHNGAHLDRIVLDIFPSVCPSGIAVLMHLQQVANLAGQRAGIGVSGFNNLPVMAERFDFNGDGSLSATETMQLIKACLREHLRQVSPDITQAKDLKLQHKNLEDQFIVMKKLGEGGQGAMYLVRSKANQEEFRCVKFYDKSNANAPLDDIKEEFELMRQLNSPLVARTFEIFEDRTHVYLVNEPYYGGDLTKLVANASEAGVVMTEDWFRRVFIQPVQGIQYINQQHLMHCDLKEANIMVATGGDWQHPHVVLIDFGLAAKFAGDALGACGTPGYIPPETWQKEYWIPKGDVFSLGVVFFQLLGGINQLFAGYMGAMSMDDVSRATIGGQPPFQMFNDKPDFQQLVVGMLEKDPQCRCTITQASMHPWFMNQTGTVIDPQVLNNIKNFSRKSETQLKVAELMLDRFNVGGLNDLNAAFMAMDRDMSGCITIDEARQGASQVAAQLGLSPMEMESFVVGIADSSGHVSYKRFMGAMIQQQKEFSTADLWGRFCEMDLDRNGILDQGELLQVMRSMGYPEQDAYSMLVALDQDGDGKVTFEEFKAAMIPQ